MPKHAPSRKKPCKLINKDWVEIPLMPEHNPPGKPAKGHAAPIKTDGKPKSTNRIPENVNYYSRLLAVLLLCVIYDVTELIYDFIETMIDQIRTYDR